MGAMGGVADASGGVGAAGGAGTSGGVGAGGASGIGGASGAGGGGAGSAGGGTESGFCANSVPAAAISATGRIALSTKDWTLIFVSIRYATPESRGEVPLMA
jgi:hypothetical protein